MSERNEDFWIARGRAIQAFATLEQSMATVFAIISGTTEEVGGITFFKMTSFDARTSAIEKLQRISYGDEYNSFWNSLLRQLNQINKVRNAIVHWNVIGIINGRPDGQGFDSLNELRPPTYFMGIRRRILAQQEEKEPGLRLADLHAFIYRCNVYSRCLNMFTFTVNFIEDAEQFPGFEPERWLEIFHKPFEYPIPDDHPLALTQEQKIGIGAGLI